MLSYTIFSLAHDKFALQNKKNIFILICSMVFGGICIYLCVLRLCIIYFSFSSYFPLPSYS